MRRMRMEGCSVVGDSYGYDMRKVDDLSSSGKTGAEIFLFITRTVRGALCTVFYTGMGGICVTS